MRYRYNVRGYAIRGNWSREDTMTSGLSAEVVGKLQGIFGERVSTAREDTLVAGSDATKRVGIPAAVVWAMSAEEVVKLVKLANEAGFAVVPRGAASGLTGGAVPAAGSVVADLSRMDRTRLKKSASSIRRTPRRMSSRRSGGISPSARGA